MRWTIKYAAILTVQASVNGGGDSDLCFVYEVDIHKIVPVPSQVVRSLIAIMGSKSLYMGWSVCDLVTAAQFPGCSVINI
jgi:hypothetical protein